MRSGLCISMVLFCSFLYAQSGDSAKVNNTTTSEVNEVTGTGTLQFLPLWLGTNQLGNSVIFQGPGRKLGVGTKSPTAQLDVRAGARVRGLSVHGGNAPDGSSGNGADGMQVRAGDGDPTFDGDFGGTGLNVTGGNGSGGGPGIVVTGGTGIQGGGAGGVFIGGDSLGDGIDVSKAPGCSGEGCIAGNFMGDVVVRGTLTATTKHFRIDHPLDPANKYLVHASVESSEMKNIYDGMVTLDKAGEAVVQLPNWFDAMNGNVRYQLTAVGAPGPGLYIAQKVSGNRFKIAGGTAGGEVSWQITGVRQDAYAKANPLVPEQEKGVDERGYYLNPELYGAPEEKSVEWALHPALMRELQARRSGRDSAISAQGSEGNASQTLEGKNISAIGDGN